MWSSEVDILDCLRGAEGGWDLGLHRLLSDDRIDHPDRNPCGLRDLSGRSSSPFRSRLQKERGARIGRLFENA